MLRLEFQPDIETQEDTFVGTLFCLKVNDIRALIPYFALGNLIAFAACDGSCRVLFPEPLGPIMACTSPLFTPRFNSFYNFLAVNLNMQVFNV